MRVKPTAEIKSQETLQRLQAKLGYTFSNLKWLQQALTHRSKQALNNERLEFLGDSILGFVIASELYKQFPKAKEGELSRCRSALVRGDTLAELARDLDLSDFLLLGSGELKSGGFRRKSTLADAFEAIIGAIYLDGGIDAAQGFVIRNLSDRLQTISPEDVLKDPKTRLQEYLQARQLPIPEYALAEAVGKQHAQVFFVSCQVAGISETVIGEGASRRKAEQAAAEKALKQLKESSVSGGLT